ncbi:MAG TPA: VWA domain-containing protein [Caldilineaceae bacterium]|nr:VWA domain-containing protein [Caldilineaceae bacterium]
MPMIFTWPLMLLSLLVLPLFIWIYWRAQQRRQRLTTAYGTLGVVRETAGRRPLGWRRHLPPLFFLLGLTTLLIALARPVMTIGVPRWEGTLILAFDVSGSMAADDLAPSRMEAAKAAAIEFVQRQPPSVRIGVVAFADSGFAIQLPTNDQAVVLSSINRLAPERGTSLAYGIASSIDAIYMRPEPTRIYSDLTPTPTPSPTPVEPGSNRSAAIVLITDGENTVPPEPLEAAQLAADRGVRVYPIGIGSPAGTTLEVEGFIVHTRLDEPTLQQIAAVTQGIYYNAQNDEDLRTIYDALDPEFVIRTETLEVTAIFAGIGTLLLLIGGGFSLAWFSRLP